MFTFSSDRAKHRQEHTLDLCEALLFQKSPQISEALAYLCILEGFLIEPAVRERVAKPSEEVIVAYRGHRSLICILLKCMQAQDEVPSKVGNANGV